MKPAVEPELLIWENFGVSKLSRAFRILFYIIFVFCMLVFCFYIVSLLEAASNTAQDELSGVQCPANVDSNAANLDYYAKPKKRTGDFHCFCKNMLSQDGLRELTNYKFPLDNQTHCVEWYGQYWLILATIGAIAVLIIFGNIVVEILVQQGSAMTRPVNEQMIMKNAIRAISWIQFINLGLVLFMLNIGIKGTK